LPEEKQVKSKRRVADHGEVFTAQREVNAMLDMVKPETERIESRFLEPACGNGNFLSEVLQRKLNIVGSRYGKNRSEYERYCFVAVSSIYGVDILEDNVKECRARMFDIVFNEYESKFKKNRSLEFPDSLHHLLNRNIQCGDALTLTAANGKPIIFSEWSLISGNKVKRRDFSFAALLKASDAAPTFDDIQEMAVDEEQKGKAIPIPIKDYPITSYLKVANYE
jgi:hypothetical protein